MLSFLCDLAAPPPSLTDNTADIDRLLRAVAEQRRDQPPLPLEIPFRRLGLVAARFRAAAFRGSAVLNHRDSRLELVDFLPQRPSCLPGLALDLGTTFLEATLLDLSEGRVLARGRTRNRQDALGADILSRIHHSTRGEAGANGPASSPSLPSGLVTMQGLVRDSIDELAAGLATEAGIASRDIRALTVAGNTTMIHFLLGLTPYHLCREPYIPLVCAPDSCRAAELGLGLHPEAPVWCFPGVGSYFGGDLVAGILACGLDQAEHTRMLIDVGTNAEVVLGNRDWLIACAGAAGPALEGGVARMGMRAGPGAIERVRIQQDPWRLEYRTIGETAPLGLCGSGLIDLVAELFLARLIDRRGHLRRPEQVHDPRRRDFLRERLREDSAGLLFRVSDTAGDQDSGPPVELAQVELDAIMRSKAAMYAILSTITAQVGIGFDELERIEVAGAFGRHIDPRQAIVLGMLPDLPPGTYRAVGNSALTGAELALRDDDLRGRARSLAGRITYEELNVNQDFMLRFSGGRFIPHTDGTLFPTVPEGANPG
ncbi:MAG: [Fe-S]-binding protein [Desulfobulbaceae bacterium A2]|nr:MAG: [Fe-S]-binding protein [Desulfobulbaceae bacterium A2]